MNHLIKGKRTYPCLRWHCCQVPKVTFLLTIVASNREAESLSLHTPHRDSDSHFQHFLQTTPSFLWVEAEVMMALKGSPEPPPRTRAHLQGKPGEVNRQPIRLNSQRSRFRSCVCAGYPARNLCPCPGTHGVYLLGKLLQPNKMWHAACRARAYKAVVDYNGWLLLL